MYQQFWSENKQFMAGGTFEDFFEIKAESQ